MSDQMRSLDTRKDYHCSACNRFFPKDKWIIVVKPQRGYDLIMCPYCKTVRGIPK